MRKIKLTKGKCAIIDEANFAYLNQWKWFYNDGGYACRSQHIRISVNKYTSKRVFMHRIVNNTPNKYFTDHINRNKLDNRKENLRTCDKSLNSINRDKPSNNTSGVRGVHFDSWSKKWRADLGINGKKKKLGRFDNIKDAMKARLLAEKKYHAI